MSIFVGMRKGVYSGMLAIAFCLVGLGLKAQSLTLNYFLAAPDGSDVLVTWEVPTEQGISTMRLFRKIDAETDFSPLTTLTPNGQMAYQYLDYSLGKDTPKSITYKLQVVRGTANFTYYTTIAYNPTSVQQTWGSIKKMFR